jgi:Multiubiquitin
MPMETVQTPATEHAAPPKTVTVTVNGKAVVFHEHRATGAAIKAAAIAQGVAIQPDFNLFEVKGPGKLKPVGDADPVELHEHQEFRAVAPDDNS